MLPDIISYVKPHFVKPSRMAIPSDVPEGGINYWSATSNSYLQNPQQSFRQRGPFAGDKEQIPTKDSNSAAHVK